MVETKQLIKQYCAEHPKQYDEIVDLVESLDKTGLAVLLMEVGRQIA